MIAPNQPSMALIERGMSEPAGIPLAKAEREIADRTRATSSPIATPVELSNIQKVQDTACYTRTGATAQRVHSVWNVPSRSTRR